MKRSIYYIAILFIVISNNKAIAQRNCDIWIMNSTFFNIKADGYPEKGEGIFINYQSIIEKGKEVHYSCHQDNTLKGVEGHLKLRAYNGEVSGIIDIYFDNPAIGDLTFTVNADWPFVVENIHGTPKRNQSPNAWINIKVDTTRNTNPVNPLTGSGHTSPKQNLEEPIPPVINFDWQVVQRIPKDEDDDNDGKAYNEVTYFFTSSGDYAAIKPTDKSFNLMIYSKKGYTWMFDDKKKIITVMGMPKIVGEGAVLGKEVATKINKAPLNKGKDEMFTITKTGKTKPFLSYTADEYLMKNNKVIASSNTSHTGTASFWYVKVPFDPIKIYTMGAGRPADLNKLQNDPRMKNNITAIPVLNKNYLWVETDMGGKKGLETLSIERKNNTVYTAGYKVKQIKNLKDAIQGGDDN
jgi:hypothetical protein